MGEVNYYLPEGYRENEMRFYEDTIENADFYQKEIYDYARSLNPKRVIDIGCGFGHKLKGFRDVVGYDTAFHIQHCWKNHEFGVWQVIDINKPFHIDTEEGDLVLCCDVIEHLKDPEILLRSFPKGKCILSTPDRDFVRGEDDSGPPENEFHVREWNQEEFRKLLEDHGFEIEKQWREHESQVVEGVKK